MQLKSIQWNIGGGKIRKTKSVASDPSSYAIEGMDYVIQKIVDANPDIVSLQETHTKGDYSQVELIAKALGYKYWVNDAYADSHVSEGFKLGQGIISRYPISNHSFSLFFNPHFKAKWDDGSIVTSHDKGLTKCTLTMEGRDLCVMTLHAIPFRPFGVNPLSDDAKEVREDMQKKLQNGKPLVLLQGDFNFNEKSLKALLPELLTSGMEEAIQETTTTPKGRFYDHVVYKGFRLLHTGVDKSALTDHYPIESVFEFE
jgi:endonuclease/exonuclease/phosphatase family metal-dependent hydrolase